MLPWINGASFSIRSSSCLERSLNTANRDSPSSSISARCEDFIVKVKTACGLFFNLDAVHLDLRAIVVRHIAQQRAIKMSDLATIAQCIDLGLYRRVH